MRRESATLAGKTAIVTGAAKRIGGAIALALSADGVNVVVHYHSSRGEAETLAAEIGGHGAKAWTLAADLGDAAEADRFFLRACELAGPVDILVNSASVFPRQTLGDMTAADLASSVQVNAWAPLVIARALAGQGRPGAIVNLLDTRIVHGDRVHAAYHLSKRMLFTLTRMMAIEYAPRIRVNAVAPGLILPPPGEDESYLQKMASSNPLQKVGEVTDVTEAVLFLLRSEFVTGQVVFVDGGFHLKGSVYGL